MDDETTKLFVYLIMFWTVLTILGGFFEQNLVSELNDLKVKRDSYTSPTFIDKVLNIGNILLDNTPFLDNFAPLYRILTFQYSKEIPPALSVFLWMFSIYSTWIVFNMIRG